MSRPRQIRVALDIALTAAKAVTENVSQAWKYAKVEMAPPMTQPALQGSFGQAIEKMASGVAQGVVSTLDSQIKSLDAAEAKAKRDREAAIKAAAEAAAKLAVEAKAKAEAEKVKAAEAAKQAKAAAAKAAENKKSEVKKAEAKKPETKKVEAAIPVAKKSEAKTDKKPLPKKK